MTAAPSSRLRSTAPQRSPLTTPASSPVAARAIEDAPEHTVSVLAVAPSRRWERVVRRGCDITVALLVLLIVLPAFLAIALWIRLDSPGPALLRQERIGLGRRTFTMLKFRSMHVGCDDRAHRELILAELRGEDTRLHGSTKLLGDARVTRAGKFLRRTSLDELPQLINVLRGEISLVGPRPCLPWEAEMFPPAFAWRFTVPPGLTGLWQVSGRSALGTLQMLHLDLDYVRRRSLRLDFSILLRTLPALLSGGGAR